MRACSIDRPALEGRSIEQARPEKLDELVAAVGEGASGNFQVIFAVEHDVGRIGVVTRELDLMTPITRLDVADGVIGEHLEQLVLAEQLLDISLTEDAIFHQPAILSGVAGEVDEYRSRAAFAFGDLLLKFL